MAISPKPGEPNLQSTQHTMGGEACYDFGKLFPTIATVLGWAFEPLYDLLWFEVWSLYLGWLLKHRKNCKFIFLNIFSIIKRKFKRQQFSIFFWIKCIAMWTNWNRWKVSFPAKKKKKPEEINSKLQPGAGIDLATNPVFHRDEVSERNLLHRLQTPVFPVSNQSSRRHDQHCVLRGKLFRFLTFPSSPDWPTRLV